MRLIEIASVVNGVQNGNALPQKIRGVPGALDLPDTAITEPGRTQEVPLNGS